MGTVHLKSLVTAASAVALNLIRPSENNRLQDLVPEVFSPATSCSWDGWATSMLARWHQLTRFNFTVALCFIVTFLSMACKLHRT
jgi:hypothetical protein